MWALKHEEYFVIPAINEYLSEIIVVVLFDYICVTTVIEFIVDTWLYSSLPDLTLQIVPVNAMIFNCICT